MPRKVLFVDDDQVLQTLVVQLLKHHLKSYIILSASDTQQGLAQAREHQPDAIVLDILLGDENGWEAAELLKKDEKTRHIPIIVASGAGSPFNGPPYIDRSIIAKYIRKPYDVDELSEAIHEVVGDV
jgi:CheY-like chemotaxis protein